MSAGRRRSRDRIRRAVRAVGAIPVAAAIAAAASSAAEPFARQAPSPAAAAGGVDAMLMRIDRLRRDARDESLSLDARRTAADALLSAGRDLAGQHPTDPRRGEWLNDVAEDCLVTALPIGGDLDAVLLGIPTHAEWQRASATIALMADAAARGAEAARAALSALEQPGGPPLPESERALARHLAEVEIPRRSPLLSGFAEGLAAMVLESPGAAASARAGRAASLLLPLLPELDGPTLAAAARQAALAASLAGDRGATETALQAMTRASGPQPPLDDSLVAAVVRWRLDGPAAGESSLRAAEARLGDEAPLEARRRLAELEASLRRAAAAPDDGSWSEPLARLCQPGRTPGSRSAATTLRSAIVARLADVLEGRPPPPPAPLLDLAWAELCLRPGAGTAAGPEEAALRCARVATGSAPAPLRALALRMEGEALARAGRAAEAAEAFARLAREWPADPLAPDAVERAIAIARAVDAAAGGADPAARRRLEEAVRTGAEKFPDHPGRQRWRAEDAVLTAEAAVADPAREAEARESVAAARAALSALADAKDLQALGLRARLAWAGAVPALQAGRPDAALLALEQAPPPASLPAEIAAPLLAVRAAALAALDRPIEEDAALAAAAPSMDAALEAAAVRRLRAVAPAPAPLSPPAADTATAATVARLSAWAERRGWRSLESLAARAEALRATGQYQAALPLLQAALQLAPDRADLLLARAECLVLAPPPGQRAELERALAEAIRIHRRLLAGTEETADPALRTPAWWLSQLRQLQILERVGRAADDAAARLARLRARDPSLGGPDFRMAFERLAAARPAPAGAPGK